VQAGGRPGGALGDDLGQHCDLEGVELAGGLYSGNSFIEADDRQPVALGERLDVGPVDIEPGPVGQPLSGPAGLTDVAESTALASTGATDTQRAAEDLARVSSDLRQLIGNFTVGSQGRRAGPD
jgi:hypothetical protein